MERLLSDDWRLTSSIFQLTLSYVSMQIFMTYSIWLGLALCLGGTAGFCYFEHQRRVIQRTSLLKWTVFSSTTPFTNSHIVGIVTPYSHSSNIVSIYRPLSEFRGSSTAFSLYPGEKEKELLNLPVSLTNNLEKLALRVRYFTDTA